jgi:iron only hydrogenase large subunit-like protein
VLTTRELARMIRSHGIDLNALEPEPADSPLGERTTAGKIFGVTGGVMEAAVRTACHLVTGEEMDAVPLKAVRGLAGRKQARVRVGELELGVAVVSGLGHARALLEEIRAGRDDLHFIEVMTCPGGCINGGGQPLRADGEAIRARMKALYRIDRDEPVRRSHENESVRRLYAEFLGEPMGEKSHELLHTAYAARAVVV